MPTYWSDGVERYKGCKGCNQSLPITSFPKKGKSKNGYQQFHYLCFDCRSIRYAERYAKKAKKYRKDRYIGPAKDTCPSCGGEKVLKAKQCLTCSNVSRGISQKYSDGIEEYKSCKYCNQTLPVNSFRLVKGKPSARCRRCLRVYEKELYRKQGQREKKAAYGTKMWRVVEDRRLKKEYGISMRDVDAIYKKQGGVCAICGGRNQNKSYKQPLCVDHDHETGNVRGLLCNKCNPALGLFRDSKEFLLNAIRYLEVPCDIVA